MYKLAYILLIFISMQGCATESHVQSDQIWPEDKQMIRLEREVQEQCDALVKSVSPDSVSITWFDNIHPHAPMLSEAYVASMYERSLMRKGFLVKKEGESANYKLLLAMTPSKRSLLILSTLSNIDSVVATRESYYVNGSEKWNKDLCSYRIRTKTRIPIGSRP